MADWDDVHRIAAALPEVTERPSYDDRPAWRVKDKAFAWDRPLRKADLAALGPTAPDGPVLAASVPDLGAKEALLADDPSVYFTTPHFDGYAAVLVRLDAIDVDELEELLTEAWLCRAPKRLAKQFEADR
ncbi:MmcQ/YjbR family DNA-binding protein [Saccharothrix stipae]